MKIKYLFDLILCKFPKEAKLKLSSKKNLRNQIFNSAMETVPQCHRQKRMARYTSAKEIFIDHLETKSDVECIRYQAVREAWMGWLDVAHRLEQGFPEELGPP